MDDPVQAQLEAYNARDLDAFVACYSPGIVISQPDGTPVLTGHDQLRARYGALFSSPGKLRAEVPRRISAGSWVVDEEHVAMDDRTMDVLVAYQVVDWLIVRAIMLM